MRKLCLWLLGLKRVYQAKQGLKNAKKLQRSPKKFGDSKSGAGGDAPWICTWSFYVNVKYKLKTPFLQIKHKSVKLIRNKISIFVPNPHKL